MLMHVFDESVVVWCIGLPRCCFIPRMFGNSAADQCNSECYGLGSFELAFLAEW